MEAVQAATGHGGWPMTVFLTADGEPFYFGTYFPPEARHGVALVPAGAGGGGGGLEGPARRGRRGGRADRRRSRGAVAGPRGRRGAGGVRGRPGAARADPGVRRAARRVRGRAEAPAVHGGRVPAAALRPYRVRGRAPDGRRHLCGDGPGRDLRPARRRVRAVLRGPGVDRPALREDALRQRPAVPRLRPSVAGHRVGRGPADRPGDRRVHGAGAAHRRGRVRLSAGRRQRGRGRPARRGRLLRVDARAIAGGARRGRRRLRRRVLRGHRGRHLRGGRLRAPVAG
ncbi:hypothetical protein SCALM49S_00285 [Streptomyces californicus]